MNQTEPRSPPPREDFIDPFGRTIEYVRLSVTDKCNLRCFYCLPEGHKDFEEAGNRLSFDEIETVMAAFGELGVRRVRITGGEPLLRKDLPVLVGRLAALPGIEDLSVSTNAYLLERDARALKEAGVGRINVSLDSLRADRFRDITRGAELDRVLGGLRAAREAGLDPVKINMVAMKGINDDEVEDMVEFCIEQGFTLRFIETMPLGTSGSEASKHYLDLQQVKARLAERYELTPSMMPGGGPARYYRIGGSELKIGFITPISQHFCETCNRVRMSVDGTLYMCLGQEHNYPLRPLLRDGVRGGELKEHLLRAIAMKPERHEFREKPHQIVRFMSATGG
ncbi:MAG: GTP 3',8-cyclase MoaA [Gammaproteobacteria bacterium]|nr:GTP 3',8-cyclase MoaA [Gammaproteobacteria bacterium]